MKASRNGFTLLELLVALTVLGLIMVGVVQGVHFGITSWDREARHVDAIAELDGVDRLFRELAHGISPVRNGDFDGRPDRVAFTGELPLAVSAGNRSADLALYVSGDHRLVLRWIPHRHATILVSPRAREVEVLRNVRGIQFSYWSGRREANGWQSSLSRTLPSLIRVRIVFMPGDPRHWPELIVTPMITSVGTQL